MDIEPEDAVNIEPLDGFLSPEGSATLHFKRSSNSASVGRINCKVCLIVELGSWLDSEILWFASRLQTLFLSFTSLKF